MLASLRIEFPLGQWEEAIRGQPTTPLAALASAPRLQYLDVMFVDSSEGSEGCLDGRLMSDLGALHRVEEVEVWTRGVGDWHEDLSFQPLAACTRLRSLKMEVGAGRERRGGGVGGSWEGVL